MSWKEQKSREEFWRVYEDRIGEKVFAYALGRYISGWTGYDQPFWGLLIVSAGGFRFHHFPHEGWLNAAARAVSGGEPPEEKVLFIPAGRIIKAELYLETVWWKRLFLPSPPMMDIRYLDDSGAEQQFRAETDAKAERLAEFLKGLKDDKPR
ncbi:hypothetical protein LJC14_07380 [Treponema sp. OttesenSCG-928-L16]|nr:hypothetical protein [Treponema sp. OttesenSCG-928-L16]